VAKPLVSKEMCWTLPSRSKSLVMEWSRIYIPTESRTETNGFYVNKTEKPGVAVTFSFLFEK